MGILIAGGTGLVGTQLIQELIDRGYRDIRLLTRNPASPNRNLQTPVRYFQWNLHKKHVDSLAFKSVKVIVNLAGEGIASKRWTEKRKREILHSRIESTRLLLDEACKHQQPIKYISASAIGYYGDRNDQLLVESDPVGTGFLSEVCHAWEQQVLAHTHSNISTYILRLGIVLAKNGGALQKLLPIFKSGLGGPIGRGRHIMSWIHIEDLVNQFIFVLENDLQHSLLNAVSPHPVSNTEFSKTLGHILNRPALLPAPELALKVLYGEMSHLILDSQNVSCQRIEDAGFKFKFPELAKALEDLCKPK